MNNITIKLEIPDVTFEEINKIAQENNVTLTQSGQRNFDASQATTIITQVLNTAASVVTLIDFFTKIKKQYEKRRVIKAEITEDGKTNRWTLAYIIKYLEDFKKNLLNKSHKEDSHHDTNN